MLTKIKEKISDFWYQDGENKTVLILIILFFAFIWLNSDGSSPYRDHEESGDIQVEDSFNI